MTMVIKTNNRARPLLAWSDLTKKEQAEMDYAAPESADDWHRYRFFLYKGGIYDTHEFVRIARFGSSATPSFSHLTDDVALLKWEGIQTDSFFSGVVIRYTDDFESVIVGLALC